MRFFIAKRVFILGYWFIYLSSLIDGETAREMLLLILEELMKNIKAEHNVA